MKWILSALLIFFVGSSTAAAGESDWHLSRDRQDIKVYTRHVKGIAFKQYKGIVDVQAPLSSVIALFEDHAAAKKWIDTCDYIKLVEVIAPNESITYSYNLAPWPAKDRDAVVRNVITQDPETLVVHIVQNAVKGYVPRDRKAVRVEFIEGMWELVPIDENRTRITYQVLTDPGGNIPARLVNAVAISQPFNTLLGLRDIVTSEKYKNAHFDFIIDWKAK